MNTFYGKSVNQMNYNELTLLSVDIQLSSFEMVRNIPTKLIEQSYMIREGLMYECMGNDGNYSREQFINDFNGTSSMKIEGGYSDFIEINNRLCLN